MLVAIGATGRDGCGADARAGGWAAYTGQRLSACRDRAGAWVSVPHARRAVADALLIGSLGRRVGSTTGYRSAVCSMTRRGAWSAGSGDLFCHPPMGHISMIITTVARLLCSATPMGHIARSSRARGACASAGAGAGAGAGWGERAGVAGAGGQWRRASAARVKAGQPTRARVAQESSRRRWWPGAAGKA